MVWEMVKEEELVTEHCYICHVLSFSFPLSILETFFERFSLKMEISSIPVSTCIFIYFKYLSKKKRKRKKKRRKDVNITREGKDGRDTLLTN